MDILATSFSGNNAQANNSTEYMRQKAEELEAVFLNTLVSEMFSSIDTEGDFGGGYAEETWRGMQSEQYAATMAKTGGIGIADQIMRSLLQVQEVTNSQNPDQQHQGTAP